MQCKISFTTWNKDIRTLQKFMITAHKDWVDNLIKQQQQQNQTEKIGSNSIDSPQGPHYEDASMHDELVQSQGEAPRKRNFKK